MSRNLKVLNLYKNLLKESSKFTNYNFRFATFLSLFNNNNNNSRAVHF